MLSDPRSVTELEKKLAVSKKKLLAGNALLFGAARILAGDPGGAADFFSTRPGKGASAEWVRWYEGFALLLARRFEPAADAFTLLAREGRDGVLAALSSFFLEENLAVLLPRRAGELRNAAAAGRERVRRILRTRADWNREIARVETEVYAAVLSAHLGKAADYIYR